MTSKQHDFHKMFGRFPGDDPSKCFPKFIVTAVEMLPFFSQFILGAYLVWWKLCTKKPYNKEPHGVISGARAGHPVGPSCPIQRSEKCSSKRSRTSKDQWRGAPSSKKMMFGMSCNSGITTSSTWPGMLNAAPW